MAKVAAPWLGRLPIIHMRPGLSKSAILPHHFYAGAIMRRDSA